MYTGSYRNLISTVSSILNVENTDTIEKGQLVALNIKNYHLQPLIVKVLEVNAETYDVLMCVTKRQLQQVIEGCKEEGRTHLSRLDRLCVSPNHLPYCLIYSLPINSDRLSN